MKTLLKRTVVHFVNLSAVNNTPIFDFTPLRDYLIKRGYQVKEFESSEPKKLEYIEDPIEAIKDGKLSVRDDGIFTIDPETGKEYRTYMYKYDYYVSQYGANPRYHICKCETLEKFIEQGRFNGHYRNGYKRENIPVWDITEQKEILVSELPLCSYCRHKLSEFGDKTFKEFTDMLETSRLDAAMGTDIFGYTQGWERISREYRESKDYTCEICGLKIENPLDRMYMHCHHKNGDKTNNDFSNLQCLCIRCHSQVDQRHATNFSKGANLNELKDFEEKYPLK